METNNDLHDVKNDVELLKRDVSNMQRFISKLETAIDKITAVSADVGKILTVHETRLEQVEYETREGKRLNEKETDLIHARISQKEAELRREMDRNHTELMEFLRDHDGKSTEAWSKMNERVLQLEKWKWSMAGIAAIAGLIAIPIIQHFFGN